VQLLGGDGASVDLRQQASRWLVPCIRGEVPCIRGEVPCIRGDFRGPRFGNRYGYRSEFCAVYGNFYNK
jgi:hypothetical protein